MKEQGEIYRIVQSDILYIESFGHNLEINTIDEKYNIRKSIAAIEKELDGKDFVRCHRSYIVGLKHVKRIGKNTLELDNGTKSPVSRGQYSATNRAFIEYYKSKR